MEKVSLEDSEDGKTREKIGKTQKIGFPFLLSALRWVIYT